jgi:excinuclease UvrABC nuclease subunit
MFLSTVDVNTVEQEVKASEEAVNRLLDNEKRALERLAEVAAIADQDVRLEEAAKLVMESNALIDMAKQMSDVIGRASKRMASVKTEVLGAVKEEVQKLDGGKWEGSDYQMMIKKNPDSVVVDALKDVPKKYRLEPKPIPSWEKWPANKNAIKQALTKEKVSSIKGVHLEQGERLEVKPR